MLTLRNWIFIYTYGNNTKQTEKLKELEDKVDKQ